MKNNEYSKVNYPFLKIVRKEYKNNLNFFTEMKNVIQNNIVLEGHEKRGVELQEITMIENIVNGNFVNFYIESKELSDFFIKTEIKEQTIYHIVDSLNDLSKKIGFIHKEIKELFSKDGITTNKEITQVFNFTGRIYCKSFIRTIFFEYTSFCVDSKPYAMGFITGGGDPGEHASAGMGGIIMRDGKVITNFFTSDPKDKILDQERSLFMNMIFYMNAFPDKILNSPPDEVCDKLNINNSRTISTSKQISDYLRETSPHLRRGHFRYLASDYFKNKKGQTVFVNPSFIGGKAKTIIK